MPARTRVVYGCGGTQLTADERQFFADAMPWGFILFARNFDNPEQAKHLVSSVRECVGDPNAPVLIDQEGGRVQRLKPPHWKARPAARRFGELYERNAELAREAVYLNARLIAHDLAELGISIDCVPVLDVPIDGSSNVIGDRAFGSDLAMIIELGRAMIEGVLDGGVLPVMKHAPGHGRATADSHFDLPRVSATADQLSATDFVPFRALAGDCPCAMSAHVVYEAIDSNRPGTTSPRIIQKVIRGEIGFEGLLFTDDLSMNALSGSLASRTEKALSAGCDIICHCNGKMDEMKDVAAAVKPLEGPSAKRAERALSHLHAPKDLDLAAAEDRVTELLGVAA